MSQTTLNRRRYLHTTKRRKRRDNDKRRTVFPFFSTRDRCPATGVYNTI